MATFLLILAATSLFGSTLATYWLGYDRCDLTFCTGKGATPGTWQVSPCSKYYCSCDLGAVVKFSAKACPSTPAPSGSFYDGTSCLAPAAYPECQNATVITPTPNPWPAVPATESGRCNVQNCKDRNGAYAYFALNACTPNWCYCAGSATNPIPQLQRCALGTYFDFRAEFVACRNATLLQWCSPQALTTTVPPTAAPTTPAPTTAPPSTAAPTTAAPTTAAPTTAATTTPAPTTAALTTVPPTTTAPTTAAPTTAAPTTAAPTTAAPTTAAPTTAAHTTPAPTTPAPTTAALTTVAPTTAAPTTAAPTTAAAAPTTAPSTAAPTTAAPTTAAPTTAVPTTPAPTTAALTTVPPTTAAPTTTAPTTAAPTTTLPMTTAAPLDLCTPPVSPFTWGNPLSWPLTYASMSQSGATTNNVEVQNSLNAANADAIKSYIVRKHDCLRSQEPASNMLKMEWNDEAAAKAQTLANQCVFAHDASRNTSQFQACGQNIAAGSAWAVRSWEDSINAWWVEKSTGSWVYGTGSTNSHTVGHFTQVVWAASFQVGCGFKYCPGAADTGTSWSYLLVCNYCPAGNYNQLPYKQGAACGDCLTSCSGGKLCTNACPVMNYPYGATTCDNPTFHCIIGCEASCQCQADGRIYDRDT